MAAGEQNQTEQEAKQREEEWIAQPPEIKIADRDLATEKNWSSERVR
jgi:hypothetical protein